MTKPTYALLNVFSAASLKFFFHLSLIPSHSIWETQHYAEKAFCFMVWYKRTYYLKVMGYVADST